MAGASQQVLVDYLTDPNSYWEGLGWRQAEKLRTSIGKAAATARISRIEVIDRVAHQVELRSTDRPPPVYIVSIGGAGSHWLGNMLGDLPGLVDAAEVYIPAPLEVQMGHLDDSDQAQVVDGIHLIHAWARTGDWESVRDCTVVNTAHRPQSIETFRKWDPATTIIHLVRDPRDRALSVTYRKPIYRSQAAPGIDDATYLRRKAKRNQTYLGRYMRSEHRADLEVRYEEIKADPTGVVRSICNAMGLQIADGAIARAVHLNDSEKIRAGVVESKGNLDEGGPSRSWRSASRHDRLLLHHVLAYPVDVLGYPDDDCLARDAIPKIVTAERVLTTHALDHPVRMDYSVDGAPWRRVEKPILPENAVLRIRPRGARGLDRLEEVVRGLRPHVLCLAGVRQAEDGHLGFLSAGSELIGLDLAGTAITGDLESILQRLTALEWVSATDTPLEEWALEKKATEDTNKGHSAEGSDGSMPERARSAISTRPI